MRLSTRVWNLQFPSFNHARVKEAAVMNNEAVFFSLFSKDFLKYAPDEKISENGHRA
jgi:hypothetical protein